MTVKELIKQLKKCNQNKSVTVSQLVKGDAGFTIMTVFEFNDEVSIDVRKNESK
jgi:hypothetical protein